MERHKIVELGKKANCIRVGVYVYSIKLMSFCGI